VNSIRRTLTIWLLGALGTLVVVAGPGLFIGVRAALTRQFDQTLLSRASALISATRWDGAKVEMDLSSEAMPWYQPSPAAEYFELRQTEPLSGSGETLLVRSASLGTAPWSTAERGNAAAMPIADAVLPDGRPGRVASIAFRPGVDEELSEPGREERRAAATATAPNLVVLAAKGRAELDGALNVLALALGAAGLGIGVGIVAVVRIALSRGLAPLDRLAADVRSIGAESLSRRLNVESLPAELRPTCAGLNELLDRLEAAFGRERRFTAAAAHELRTPIAELRSILEVALNRPRDSKDYRRAAEDALGITVQMQRMVGSLLMLARHESGQQRPELGAVDLGAVLSRVRDRYASDARARGGEIRIQTHGPLRAIANEDILELVLDNLLANAVQYAAPRPDIRCTVRASAHDGWEELDVCNTVAGVSATDIEHFFEPFWRQSAARSERSHLGLGLALARRCAESMGGRLTADLLSPIELRLRLTLPRFSDSDAGIHPTGKRTLSIPSSITLPDSDCIPR
jgi:signal transduction histidine kinase